MGWPWFWVEYIFFRIVSLDPASYYMDKLPVHFDIWYILLLNAGVLVVSVVMLIAPAMLISQSGQ
ncbi:MAG: hypothetical protein V8S95_00605 [Odoribacter sp.]